MRPVKGQTQTMSKLLTNLELTIVLWDSRVEFSNGWEQYTILFMKPKCIQQARRLKYFDRQRKGNFGYQLARNQFQVEYRNI